MRSGPSLLSRLVLAAALVTPCVRASSACDPGQAETARERAKEHFTAGLRAYDAKRYSEAVDHLTCANQLLPNPAFAYNIAVTYEAMGDVPTALRWYRAHRREAGEAADSGALEAKVKQLEGKLQARGVQQVSVLSNPPGAMLSVDDRPLGMTPLTLELNPGRHRYQLVLAGHETHEGAFELRVDRSLDVEAELTPAPEVPAAPAAATAPSRAAEHDTGAPSRAEARVGTWTWISLGAGTALLGGALGFELKRAQLDSELGRTAQIDYQQRHDAMTAHQTTARVLAGAGAGALIAGGVLLALDLSRDTEQNVALGACAGDGLCLAAEGSF